jgi:PST family polysaccharide transporter
MDPSHTPLIGTKDASALDAGAPEAGPSLDRALVHGLAWTGAARWTAQLATWVATILVARLLARHDFGIWTSAGVYLGVVTLLSEFGIGASVVMIRDLSREQVAQVNGFALLTGIAGVALSWLMALPMAWFYGTPEIAGVIASMSALFLISAFRIVPLALLQRDLRFKRLAFIDAARALIQAVVLVAAAAAGLRYWTLVVGALTAETAWTIMILAHRRHRLAWPRLASIRRAVSFSTDVVVARLSWYLYANSDFLVAGRRLGQDAQGAYGLAWNLASVPVEKVSSIVISVTPAFFSAVQSDAAELRRYLLSLTQGISLIAFPAAVGLAIVADSFVATLLGPRWEPAVLPLRILALYTTVRSIGPILTPVLNAIGETRFAAINNIAALLIMPTAFIVGSHWGTAGVAAGWLVAHPLILAALYWRVATRIHLRFRDYVLSLWPALSSVLVMAAAVLGLRAALPSDLGPAVVLAAQGLAGGLTYATLLFLFHRSRVDALRRMLKLAREG